MNCFVLLDEDLTMEYHAVIKGQIFVARKSVLDLYGDVYLRGWKEAYEAVVISRIRNYTDDNKNEVFVWKTIILMKWISHKLTKKSRSQTFP